MDPKRVRTEGENEAKKTKKQKHAEVPAKMPGEEAVFFYCLTAQRVTEALAKNDILCSFVGDDADFYTTPFAAVRLVCRRTEYIGIVCHVYKVRDPHCWCRHYDAKEEMGTFGYSFQLLPGGLGDLNLYPKKIKELIEFMPGARCVEPSPERDRAAMEVTCRMLGVEPPPDWQATRASLVEAHRCKVLDACHKARKV